MKTTKSVTYLLLIAAILAGTSFKLLQISAETILWLMMIRKLIGEKFNKEELLLIFIFFSSFILALIYRTDLNILLNFKIFGLCVTTYLYFKRFEFNSIKILEYCIIINCILIWHQYISGEFIISNHSLFTEYYRERINDRPIGILFTPHASVTMLAVYLLYRIKAHNLNLKNLTLNLIIFTTALATSSLTAIAAFIVQIVIYLLNKNKYLRKYFTFYNVLVMAIIILMVINLYYDEFIDILKKESYFRYYSVEIILGQIFDINYYKTILYWLPYFYNDYIDHQESVLGIIGNEIGFIKLFVEGGIMLALFTLYVIIRYSPNFRFYIIISLLHYSFVINYPLILAMILVFEKKIKDLNEIKN